MKDNDLKLAFWYVAIMAAYYGNFAFLVGAIPLKPEYRQHLRDWIDEGFKTPSRNRRYRNKFCRSHIGDKILKWIKSDLLTCILLMDKAVPDDALAYESASDIENINKSKDAIRKLFEG